MIEDVYDSPTGKFLLVPQGAKLIGQYDAQIAFGIKRMKELHIVDGGDAKTAGIGIMTDARWKADYDLMVSSGLLPKDIDWQKAYTTRYVKDLKIMW